VRVERCWLTDVRSYGEALVELHPGRTLVTGRNGQGKTNLVEALSFLATLSSFRQVPSEAMVRTGADRAVIRAEVRHDDGREVLVEVEIPRRGRIRAQVNRQRVARIRDLLGVLRVTVFSPDDLDLVKGGPGVRRAFLDEVLVSRQPALDRLVGDLDRILRQRASLLRQMAGRTTPETLLTLDVWDTKLAAVGDELGRARSALVADLAPVVAEAYGLLAGTPGTARLRYEPAWLADGLGPALAACRSEDLRRQSTGVGPHRDDLEIVLGGMPARSHASQGEQRSLALALRLGAHRLVAARVGEQPVLVLDDVFSELDARRSEALVAALPPAQVLLTTAGLLPDGLHVDRRLWIEGSTITDTAPESV
jgi:DNA replication and repair protein RecF